VHLVGFYYKNLIQMFINSVLNSIYFPTISDYVSKKISAPKFLKLIFYILFFTI